MPKVLDKRFDRKAQVPEKKKSGTKKPALKKK